MSTKKNVSSRNASMHHLEGDPPCCEPFARAPVSPEATLPPSKEVFGVDSTEPEALKLSAGEFGPEFHPALLIAPPDCSKPARAAPSPPRCQPRPSPAGFSFFTE